MRKTIAFDFSPQEAEVLDLVWQDYVEKGLRYGWKSNVKKQYDFGHWNKVLVQGSKILIADQAELPYLKRHRVIDHLWQLINQKIGGKRSLLRVYVNAYTYGTDAYTHRDDPWITAQFGQDMLSETIIVYLNREWNKDWAGETVLFDEQDEIEFAVLPKFGRVLLFDSNKWHAARPLSRACPALRAVLVFKTIDSRILSKELQFLWSKTKDISHSGKSFFEHLYNTFLILEQREAPRDVCIAGLFHSVYGTEFFQRAIVSPDDRSFIQEMIGEYAETLVYAFCTLKDRLLSLLENRPNYSQTFRRDMLMIACANLIEQEDPLQPDPRIEHLLRELEKII